MEKYASLDDTDSLWIISLTGPRKCRDSLVESILRIDPMVSASNPPSTKLSLRVRRVASSLRF